MSIDNATRPGSNASDPTVAYARPAAPVIPQQYRYESPAGAGTLRLRAAAALPTCRTAARAASGGRRTGLIAAIVAVVLLVAGGLGAFLLLGHATVDPSTVAKEITRVTEQNERTTPTGIQCPDDVPFEKGRTFTCTASLLGKPWTYTITQNDDEGAVTIDYERPVLDPAAVTQQIATATKTEVGVEPQAVQCPSDVRFQKGGTFTCTATLDGQALNFQLTQTDDAGGVSVAHDRVVSAKEVGDTLAAALTRDVGEQVVAVCGAKGQTVIVNAPGQPISCGAANAANPARNAHVTVRIDENGDLSYTVG